MTVRRTPYQLCKEFLSIYCIKKIGDSAKLSVKKISGAMSVAVITYLSAKLMIAPDRAQVYNIRERYYQ